MPRYVIHIGPHKTGTTYLQQSFNRLRAQLAIRHVCYPEAWGGPQGHQLLAEQLLLGEDRVLRIEFDRLNRARWTNVLLSSETFSYFTDDQVRHLQALLGGEPAIVVFYCRRWSELIPSGWREIIKHGSLETLPEYVQNCLSDPSASRLINFELTLARYATIFGVEHLRVVSYNDVLESGQDLLTHFCRCFLAWPNSPSADIGRVNESLDLVDSELVRVLNALHWTRTREISSHLYHRYRALKDKLPVHWLVERAMQYVVSTIHINDEIPSLAQIHTEIANRYAQALVPPTCAKGLFTPRAAEVTICPVGLPVGGRRDRTVKQHSENTTGQRLSCAAEALMQPASPSYSMHSRDSRTGRVQPSGIA